MTEPNERSDPVEGYTDVTPEQLDALHANCHRTTCEGYMRAQAARAIASSTGQLERLEQLAAAYDSINAAVQATRQVDHDGLAQWERDLLEGVERERQADLAREALQAGLQHQRIGMSRMGNV